MISEAGRRHGNSFFDSTEGRYESRAYVMRAYADDGDAAPRLDRTARRDGEKRFPLANKRGTRLRGDHAQTKR
jgi:hypothetical protein